MVEIHPHRGENRRRGGGVFSDVKASPHLVSLVESLYQKQPSHDTSQNHHQLPPSPELSPPQPKRRPGAPLHSRRGISPPPRLISGPGTPPPASRKRTCHHLLRSVPAGPPLPAPGTVLRLPAPRTYRQPTQQRSGVIWVPVCACAYTVCMLGRVPCIGSPLRRFGREGLFVAEGLAERAGLDLSLIHI